MCHGVHALVVFGGVVVGDDRHHGLTDAETDVQRQALRLEDNTHGSKRNVAVAGHELVDHDVVHVEQEHGKGRGTTHVENAAYAPTLRYFTGRQEAQHGTAAQRFHYNDEVETRDTVGERGGDARADDLIAARQQNEHEQRVKNDVDHASERDAEAGFARFADAADIVGKDVGQNRGRTAEDDHAQGIGAGEGIGFVSRAEQEQKRTHEQKH